MLSCLNGHRYDSNKRGFLNSLDPTKGIAGDPRDLLDARAAFLATGRYERIADAVSATLPSDRPLSVLDAGSGTGYYLARLLRQGLERDGLALDASAAAVAMSVAAADSPGLVADTWRPLPIRDSRADALICIFAPRNADEFARILRPDGRLVVVTPGPRHLHELRRAGLVMGMQDDKRDRLAAALGARFAAGGDESLEYEMTLSEAEGRLLAGMGPSGHHETTGDWAGGAVTVEVDVSVWLPR